MGKKFSIGTVIGISAVTAAVTFVITGNVSLNLFNKKIRSVSEKQDFYIKLSEADNFVRSNYINEIDEKQLLDDIMSGYIQGLDDPYARYYSADEYASQTAEYTGKITGLGFTWEKDSAGYAVIDSIYKGSPAEEYGLVKGDVVMAVNNVNINSYPGGYQSAVGVFSSPDGTKVKLHIKRTNTDGTTVFRNLDMIAAETDIISVTGSIRGNIGYIRISSFNDLTAGQLSPILDVLSENGADKYIFDVRDNKGGSLESLSAVLELLLPSGDIVTADYPTHQDVAVRTNDEIALNGTAAVIVNSGTIGEAELFAFALRDELGAVIVGKNTYGKGVIQETYKCTDGSAVRFSSASVHTKNSGDFNGIGLRPDYDISLPAGVDPFRLTAAEQEMYDSQLIKAIEVVSAV